MIVCGYINSLRRLTTFRASLLQQQKSLVALPFTVARERLNEHIQRAKGAVLTTPHVPLLRGVYPCESSFVRRCVGKLTPSRKRWIPCLSVRNWIPFQQRAVYVSVENIEPGVAHTALLGIDQTGVHKRTWQLQGRCSWPLLP